MTPKVIDIECPVGTRVAKLVKHSNFKHEPLFFLFRYKSECSDNKIINSYQRDSKGATGGESGQEKGVVRLSVFRSGDKKNRNQFKILGPSRETIASISKRYEKLSDRDKSLLYEDHYVRVIVEAVQSQSFSCDAIDRAVILSTALILVSRLPFCSGSKILFSVHIFVGNIR